MRKPRHREVVQDYSASRWEGGIPMQTVWLQSWSSTLHRLLVETHPWVLPNILAYPAICLLIWPQPTPPVTPYIHSAPLDWIPHPSARHTLVFAHAPFFKGNKLQLFFSSKFHSCSKSPPLWTLLLFLPILPLPWIPGTVLFSLCLHRLPYNVICLFLRLPSCLDSELLA